MPDSVDPMAAVRQYVEAFNNGDESAMAAACADPMQILDGMSPHVWQGPAAAQDWYRDALAEDVLAEGRYPGSGVAPAGVCNGLICAVAASSRTDSAGRMPSPGRYPG